ncbi:MAG: hypothetical protein SGI73_13600 [Chloroflexota bacterium]|nr:hypothetical protein [Chloroflexota bacterium]
MTIAPPATITTVISDFLGSAPSLEEIIAFRLPEAIEQRSLELLAKNREGTLTPDVRAEMDEFTRMGQFMNRVKLRARLKLAGLE